MEACSQPRPQRGQGTLGGSGASAEGRRGVQLCMMEKARLSGGKPVLVSHGERATGSSAAGSDAIVADRTVGDVCNAVAGHLRNAATESFCPRLPCAGVGHIPRIVVDCGGVHRANTETRPRLHSYLNSSNTTADPLRQ